MEDSLHHPNTSIMRIVVQNLQKQSHLGTDIIMSEQYKPDVLLAQEINVSTEDAKLFVEGATAATNVSKRLGYGTAIHVNSKNNNDNDDGRYSLTNIRRVDSPHAETGGFIRKKTIIATLTSTSGSSSTTGKPRGIQFVSFHGYNGQPFTRISYLVDHVQAVLDVLDRDFEGDASSNEAVFAGDFNTWSQAHLDAIQAPLQRAGFRLALSWPYPGRDFALDHVFIRGRCIQLQDWSIFQNASDHQGALLTLALSKNEDESSS
jgi:endonuclease/exonuclease/phosphatase family metal-dependent hydrolase